MVSSSQIEFIMNNMNLGLVYVDKSRRIQMCNQIAKEITGIVVDAHNNHGSGKIEDGDIVVIADNKLGDDDGELSLDELKFLNINDKQIKDDDMLLAIGVYNNEKIQSQYKYIREHQLRVPVSISSNYFGFNISASIDTVNKVTEITVNGQPNRIEYYSSVGNTVVIDGKTGSIKFVQARGYSVRHEAVGDLLRGHSFIAKDVERKDIDVTGKMFLELFDKSKLSDELFGVLDGQETIINNSIYEINKRPFVCTIVPWREEGADDGVFLIIQEAENLEKLMIARNEIIEQMEDGQLRESQKELGFPEDAFKSFVGRSPQANEVKYLAYKASQNKFNVIITGESGTGKSQLAKEIHDYGTPGTPFIEVNCNAIAPSLFESELFGYVGGAFTGAKSEGKTGFFEAANGGTLFLDEIGDIPLEIQVKLLHVLQDKIIYRVGSSKPIRINVRIIAATNQNLELMVANGSFRQDLYYRINVFPIDIPPLGERKSDLYLLINHILKRVCNEYGMEMKQFSGDALKKMLSYNWPGNVRELENAIERAITLCESNIVYSEHLRIGSSGTANTLKEMLAEDEKRIIDTSMMKHNSDKQAVMEELDISRTVLYEKLKKYGIK